MGDLMLNVVSVPVRQKRENSTPKARTTRTRRRRPSTSTRATQPAPRVHQTTSQSGKKTAKNQGKRTRTGDSKTQGHQKTPKRRRAAAKSQRRREEWFKTLEQKNYETKSVLSSIFGEAPATFAQMQLEKEVQSSLAEMGMETPTRIQQLGIPFVMKGYDVMMKAQTGSGKTLAYSVPIVDAIVKMSRRISRADGPYAFILSPTRELCLQIYGVMQGLVKACNYIVPGMVVGGEKRKSEKARIRKGINILIATPGRLLDHINHTSCLSTENLRWIVLDEADRLLDMGFEKDIHTIFQVLDRKHKKHTRRTGVPGAEEKPQVMRHQTERQHWRQTVLTSATLRDGLDRLATLCITEPKFVEPKNQEESATPKQLAQRYVVVPCKKRLVTLASLLYAQLKTHWATDATLQDDNQGTAPGQKIVVFFSTINSVEFTCDLFSNLEATALRLASQQGKWSKDKGKRSRQRAAQDPNSPLLNCGLFKLHGNLPQVDRTNTFKEFCNCASGILFCTDVAARGLDLPLVHWIVQYDPPGEPAEYIHRVGRTARAGKAGNAILFLLPEEEEYIELLSRQYNVSLEQVDAGAIMDVIDQELPGYHAKDMEGGIALQRYFESIVGSENNDLGEFIKAKAVAAFQSFVRAYTTHTRETKHIFHVKNLHLGHVAKSFALRDPPSKLARHQKGPAKGQAPTKRKKRKKDIFSSLRTVDEFSSGL